MKNRTWIFIIALLFLISAGVGIYLLRSSEADYAQVWSGRELLCTLDLRIDTQFTVTSPNGNNTITVQDGKIAVTEASCPDHYCMQRGFCAGGLQIVCLPNGLEIRFVKKTEVDGIVG